MGWFTTSESGARQHTCKDGMIYPLSTCEMCQENNIKWTENILAERTRRWYCPDQLPIEHVAGLPTPIPPQVAQTGEFRRPGDLELEEKVLTHVCRLYCETLDIFPKPQETQCTCNKGKSPGFDLHKVHREFVDTNVRGMLPLAHLDSEYGEPLHAPPGPPMKLVPFRIVRDCQDEEMTPRSVDVENGRSEIVRGHQQGEITPVSSLAETGEANIVIVKSGKATLVANDASDITSQKGVISNGSIGTNDTFVVGDDENDSSLEYECIDDRIGYAIDDRDAEHVEHRSAGRYNAHTRVITEI